MPIVSRISLKKLCYGLAVLGAAVMPAQAVTHVMTSGLASATFDDQSGQITSWTLDGIEHVGQGGSLGGLSYFYRIGSSGPEKAIGNNGELVLQNVEQVLPHVINAHYTAAGKFKVTLMYRILGAGSTFSKLDMNLQLDTLSTTDQDFHLFAYNDHGLDNPLASPGDLDDQVTISPSAPTVNNIGIQVDLADGVNVRDTILGNNGFGPAFLGPQGYQAGTAASIYGMLTDGDADNLNGTLSAFSGDLAHAFQYDFLLRNINAPPDVTSEKLFTIQDFKILNRPGTIVPIPEPLTSFLGILGVGSLGLYTLRRSYRGDGEAEPTR